MAKKKRKVIIAHGWNDSPKNAWISWLAAELEARGFEVSIPVLPNPHLPRLSVWVKTLGEAVGEINKDTVLVGYSLGTPTTLRLLDDYAKDIRIAGLVLVAGFGDGILERPGALFLPPLNFKRIASRAKTRICIYSSNDPVISARRSQQLALNLGAREIVVIGAGHFLGSHLIPGSVSRLPAVLEAVLSCYRPGWKQRVGGLWRRARRWL